MASAHLEDSIGTDFESLRERLLENGPFITAADTPKQHFLHHAGLDASKLATDLSQRSQHSQQSRHGDLVDAALGRPPRLISSKSAPEPQMATMVNETPSQPVRAMASSFHAFPGGDTQPMESQVYRDYRPGMPDPLQLNTPARPIVAIENTTAKSMPGESQTELMAQNSGRDVNSYIDLAKAWPEQASQTAKSTTSEEMEDLLVSPQTQFGHQDSDRLFVMPQTPYPAARSQTAGEDMLTVERSSKTPALEGAFGSSRTPMISATQLFNQTQAVSSPLPDTIASDPILTRPSPNMQNENTLPTSHLGFSSSPVLTKARPASTAGDPRDYYTSMRESQERRRRGVVVDNMPTIDEASNESLGSMLRRQDRQRLRRTLSEQATSKHQTARVHSPANFDEHARKRRRISEEIVVDLPDDAQPERSQSIEAEEVEERNDDEVEAHVMHEDEGRVQHNVDPGEEDDAYDEFAEAILPSQPRDQDTSDKEETDEGADEEANEEPGIEHSRHQDSSASVLYKQLAPDMNSYKASLSSQPQGYEPGKVFHSTQLTAVVDSQSVPQAGGKRSLMSAYQEQMSSLTNIVPGSQYAPALSQIRTEHLPVSVSSASPQHSPLQTSPMVDAEQKVLSSPPLQASAQNEVDAAAPEVTSNGTSGNAYVTARSHVSGDAPDPTAMSGDLPDTQDSMITPLKLAGALRFSDIAGSQSHRALPREDSIDLDAIMENVITDEDQQYLKAVQSPSRHHTRKRRKVAHTIISSDHPESSAASYQQDGKQTDEKKVSDEQDTAQPQQPSDQPALHGSRSVHTDDNGDPRLASISNATSMPHAQVQQHEPWSESNHNLATLGSIRERETAGSEAVNAVANSKSNKSTSSELSGGTRKKSAPRQRRRLEQELKDKPHPALSDVQSDLTSVSSVSVPVQGSDSDSRPANELDTTAAHPCVSQEDGRSLTAARRCFALFGGGFNAYYPATIQHASKDQQTISVRFDDTSILNVKVSEVFALDLRIGDLVRIDIPVMRKSLWMIKDFVAGVGKDTTETDIHGNIAVQVQAKAAARRASSAMPESEGETHEVAISTIYLTHSLASSYRGRVTTLHAPPQLVQDRPSTPGLAASGVLDAVTPTSRAGRQLKATGRAQIAPSPAASEKSAIKAKPISRSSIFADMAFAISLSTDETQKKDIVSKIESNGGVILHNGFDELFVQPASDEKHTSANSSRLELQPTYKHLKFAALIASSCSRRAKYVQALALGLPTLSSRWIHDSLDNARNTSMASSIATTLPWSKYLLPAGESLYLHGAIRSRVLTPYSPHESTFESIVEKRSHLLDGDKVLLVAPSKSRAHQHQERVNLYTFLTMAMGAGKVKRVFSLAEADSILKHDSSWNWIHVDNDVEGAAKFLFAHGSKQKPAKKTKAKKSVTAAEKDKTACLSAKSDDADVTVVSDEYVIQSLILGALLD